MKTYSINFLLFCLAAMILIFAATNVCSQTLTYNQSFTANVGTNPGSLNTSADNSTAGWTVIGGTSGSIGADSWSAIVSIPFAFNFFGTPVSSFKVSQSGVLTFSIGTVGLPGANTSLPTAALPDLSIALMWDNFTSSPPTGLDDKVVYRVFGTAPNRQLWIKYYSFEIGSPAMTFATFSTVLEESTNNVYIIDMYNIGNLGSTTVGLQFNSGFAIQSSLSPNIPHGALSATITDNDVWRFNPVPLPVCSAPPAPGSATATPSTATCAGTPISLSLTGNSFGSGQSYQWQSSVNLAGPYINYGALLSSSFLNITSTTTMYFRCELTCTGNSQISSPVLISVNPVMSGGNYTINSTVSTGGTNFQSFTEFVSALTCGISGAIVVDVVSATGPYLEQINIPEIPGSSPANTITINGNNNLLTSAGTTGNFATLNLYGTDHVAINNLDIDASQSVNGIALHLMNTANNNTFNNCVFKGGESGACVSLSNSLTSLFAVGSNGSNNILFECTMIGGAHGYVAYGNGLNPLINSNNQILNCTIRDFGTTGIYCREQWGSSFIGNVIERPNRTNVNLFYGLHIWDCRSILIKNNRIRKAFDASLTTNALGYGIYLNGSSVIGNEHLIVNNIISDMKLSGTIYGIFATSANYWKAYHNTISFVDSTAAYGSTYGVACSGNLNFEVKNNIINLSRSGAATDNNICLLYITPSAAISNNNILYSNPVTGINYVGFDGVNFYSSLSDWQNGVVKDSQSLSLDPVFLSPTSSNYQPTQIFIDNVGSNVNVSDDIIGNLRSASTPDAGAYEFSVAPKDVGVVDYVSPGFSGCYGNAEAFVVQIKNYGAQTIDFSVDPVTVNSTVSGPANTFLSTLVSVGNLLPQAIMNVTLSPTVDLTANGIYVLNSTTFMAADTVSLNNSNPQRIINVGPVIGTVVTSLNAICDVGNPQLAVSGVYGGSIQWQQSIISSTGPWINVGSNSINYNPGAVSQNTWVRALSVCNTNAVASNVVGINVYNPSILSTTPASRCGSGTVQLGATSTGGVINWYESPSSQLVLTTGSNFLTPIIDSTTTFYVSTSSNISTSSLGLSNFFAATTNNLYDDIGLTFDAHTNFMLESVFVYPVADFPSGDVTVTIALKNSAGVTLQSTTVDLVTDFHPGIKTLVPLNFNVPVGTQHRLVMTSAFGGGIVGFISEASGGFSYPIVLPGVASITSGYYYGTSLNHYRYFYDWQIVTGCESSRVPVIATVVPPPAVTISADRTLLCVGQSAKLTASSTNLDYTYSWNPGGFTGSSVVVTPTTNTLYTLIAFDTSGNTFNQCQNIQTIMINTSSSIPPDVVVTSNSPVCEGQDVIFTSNNIALGQSNGNSYSWTGPDSFSEFTQNPILPTADASNAGIYFLTVQNSFGCTAIDSLQVNINENPALNIQSQTNVLCNGALTGAYTIEVTNPISGGTYLFNDGANVNNDGVFSGVGAGTYNVAVTDDNSCSSIIPVTITETDPTTTADAGTDQTFCVTTSAILSGNTALVGTGSWSVITGGATVTNPSDPNSTVTGLSAGLNTFRWTIDNALCANSNFDEVDINVNALPTASISGTTEICNGNSTTLTVVFTGTAPYTYSYSDGVTTFGPFTTSNATENITVAPNTTRTYTVTSVDDSNCPGTTSGSASITVTQAPPSNSVAVLSIPATGCVGDVSVVTTNAVIGATGYTWTVFPNTLINGQSGGTLTTTSPSATFTLGTLPPNESGWDICVTASNACGQTNTKCRSIRGALSTPAVISGTTVACANSSGTYSTLSVAGAAGYNWTGTNGITFTGTGTSVTANFPSGFTSGQICVAASLSCGYSSAQRCITVTNSVGQLGVMSGPFAVCPGQSGLVYSVPNNSGLSSYTWTPPSGVTITSGQGTNMVTVSVAPGYNLGSLCVTGTSNCGVTSAARCKTVSSTLPVTPGNISGMSNGVCNSTVTYSVPAVSGVTFYNWSAPIGATIVSVQGTNTVEISYPSGFSNGQLCVTAQNGCGTSSARCINIKGVSASPGVISGPISVCTGEQGLTYSIAPMFGASNYTWVVPASSTIIAGQGTPSIFVDWGTTGGLVTVTATNSCGASGTRTLNVVVNCKMSGSEIPGVFVNAYPNPVASELTVEVTTETSNTYALEMTDVSGRVVYSGQMNTTGGMKTTTVDVSNLSKGMYMLTVRSNDGFSNQIRIAVQ